MPRRLPKNTQKTPKAIPSEQNKQKASGNKSQSNKQNQHYDKSYELFAIELKWCTQQLEEFMQQKSVPPKEYDRVLKLHRTLTSVKTPLIRKRQLMSNNFGDYRQKMLAENKEQLNKTPSLEKTEVPDKSIFHKKSASLQPPTTDSSKHKLQETHSFSFNFMSTAS